MSAQPAEYSVFPDRLYSPDHEWLLLEGREARIGLTRFPLHSIGEIQTIDIHLLGKPIKRGQSFGIIQGSKGQKELYMPVSGTIFEINPKISHAPLLVNADPYEWGWLVRIFVADPRELLYLLDPHTYQEHL